MLQYATNRPAQLLLVLVVLTGTVCPARSSSAQDSQGINSDRVWLVEQASNGNMLFRGNEPLTKGPIRDTQIPFDRLLELLKTKYQTQTNGNGTFPEQFVFVDISLIDGAPTGELPYLHREYQSFGGQAPLEGEQPFMKPGDTFPPSEYFMVNSRVRGQLLWQPVAGIASRPKSNSTPEQAQETLHQQVPAYPNGQVAAPLDAAVNRLTAVMSEKLDVPKVVYLHCMNGHDRSNEMATCYLLATHPQLSLTAAMDRTIENLNHVRHSLENNDKNPDSTVPYIQSLKPDFGHAVEWYYLYNRKTVDAVPKNYQSDPTKWRD